MCPAELVSAPVWWTVTLRDGAVIRLWADGYVERDGLLVFCVQYRADQETQSRFAIEEGGASDWVNARVAEFPRDAVVSALSL